MTDLRPPAVAMPVPGYSRVTWIVLGLAVVLCYFRFRAGTGTHRELLAHGDLYDRLYRIRFAPALDAAAALRHAHADH